MQQRHDVLEALTRSYLFEGMTRDQLEPLAAAATVRRLVRGEFVVHFGDPADEIFVVLSGELKTFVVDADGYDIVEMVAVTPSSALGRVAPDATAFSGRAAGYTYNLISTWTEPGEDATHIAANRELATAMAPLSAGGAYVNFLTDSANDRVQAAYGGALYDRLARLKREYDPTNLFSRNQNIRPAR